MDTTPSPLKNPYTWTGVIFAFVLAFGGAAWWTSTPIPSRSDNKIAVVAGENFWGSLASQLGGGKVNVTSIVSDPNADPHEYESSTANARSFATADYVILNGAGYDDWGKKLLSASTNPRRRVVIVAEMLGEKEGVNPHFWYNPDFVFKVIDRITADYESIDPADTAYFKTQHDHLESALSSYRAKLSYIRQRFGGVKVAATEDIFDYLATYTTLDLISPPAFMQAVGEGNDPPARSVVTFERQLRFGAPKVMVYNLQTSTSITTNMKKLATESKIPVVGVTETLQPPTASFQTWMDGEIDQLTRALSAARRR
ncbi:MAG TPA: zinc ABC transporter substrate-binding protein [Armatimonadota bacterium]|nr:zinc ABC transporter substrate-binding protein [Armatimonadota bacterium]